MTGMLERMSAGFRLAGDYDELVDLTRSIERAAGELGGVGHVASSRGDILEVLRSARERLELAQAELSRQPTRPELEPEPDPPLRPEPEPPAPLRPREQVEPSPAVMDLIDVSDMLLMAARSDGAHGRETFELLHRRLQTALEKDGLRLIESEDARFDPAEQEILEVRPTADSGRDGVVCQTVRPGYAIGDLIVRAQQVVVYRHEEGADDAR